MVKVLYYYYIYSAHVTMPISQVTVISFFYHSKIFHTTTIFLLSIFLLKI